MVSGETKKKIKQELIKELNNVRNRNPEQSIPWYEIRARERADVRRNIVTALGYLAESGDKEVVPIIESLAKDDPFFLDMSRKKDYKGPVKKYLVREEAEKILEKLKADERKK